MADEDDPVSLWRAVQPVGDRLALSGGLDRCPERVDPQLAAWAAAGVTAVLDVRDEWNDGPLLARRAPQLTHAHVGTADRAEAVDHAWFDAGVAAARRLLAERDGRLLVHCHMGVNRGPSMAYAVLLDAGWDPVAAIEAIRRARPIAAVGHAGAALRWHLDRSGASDAERWSARRRLGRWRADHPVDGRRIAGRIRLAS